MCDSKAIKIKIEEIDRQMLECEKEVYETYCYLRGREGRSSVPSLQSKKTTIGSKKQYVDRYEII